MIFSHVLYQLSYLGIAAAAAFEREVLKAGERLECAPMANGAGHGKSQSAPARAISPRGRCLPDRPAAREPHSRR